ncbi:MAG: hypothetical protein ACO225_09460 [Ilumatobacteraceae bacterium]
MKLPGPSLLVAVLARPRLWPTVFRQVRRTVPSGWWRRRPHLPVPAPDYLRFRSVTHYGDPDHRPETADVLNYLVWCRAWDRHEMYGEAPGWVRRPVGRSGPRV